MVQSMLAVAILAAGKGTRMKSDLPKVLQELGGRSLVQWVLAAATSIQPDRRLVIVGYGADQVKASLEQENRERGQEQKDQEQRGQDQNVEFVLQAEQLGTGHAIQQLLAPLAGFAGELVVLTGDTPLLRPETIQNLVTAHRDRQASATVLTALLPDPTGYGRVFCDQHNQIEYIIEHRDCTLAQRQNRRVSAGVYCFNWQHLAEALPKLTTNNDQKEYYLTEVFNYLSPVFAFDVEDYEESFGINDRLQLAHAYQVLQTRVKQKWMRAGVTMLLPESITIDDTVELAANVIIEPQTHIRGYSKIANGCRLGPGSLIQDSQIGQNCQILTSVVDASQVGENCRVGPYAHIRGQSVVGSQCRIGNFVELKNAQLGEKTNAAHLSYLGDAQIGDRVNIGGTVTANYDGFQKHQTIIGDRSKTGSNSVLVAPLNLGANVNVAAGSVITLDVPANSLAIARPIQVIKPDYYDQNGRKRTPSAP
jgi:bifunctional UDP-N-acetylglucosamine pyrophosphorylase / glucosamine-1-phosphate N-acetyltransferase